MKNILRLTAVLMAVIMVMGTFGVSASTKLSVGSVTDGSIGPIQSGTAPVTSEEDTDLPDIGSQDTGVLPTIPELEKSVTAISRKIITPTAKLLSVPLDSTELLKIFHLDCGRKYFSVSQIEDIIDALEANGYNCLELAVGNDGLRLLLDDMSITVGGVVYSDTAVTAAIQDGNLSYYDCGDVNELTESEMDEIIAYAAARGISVIPLVNAPGHMDAILAAVNTLSGQNFAYATSTRTVDITNADAVDFTRAILSLYIEYFASKGCRVFNMGCDEYANDVYRTGSMGFGRLVSTGHYGDFINFVNSYAALVQNAGMTAMAFNDGFYFNNNVNSGTFDTDIAVAYWSSGWNFYRSMSAANLAARGHQIVNTNGDWYYVVGRTGSLGCTITKALTNIGRTPYNSVMSSGIMDVAGCMVCTWCDEPYAVYDPTEVMAQIEGFAAANSDVFAPPPPPPAPEADITVTAFETSEPYIMEGVQTVTEAGDSEIAEVILTTSGVNTGDITVSGTAADVVRDGGIYLLRSVSNTNRVLTAGMTSVSGSPRIVLSDDSDEAVLLTATRADGYTNGYYFRNSDGAYLTIGNGTAVYSDTQTVCLTASMGSVFTISDVTGTYYLNIYGGRDSYEAAGWTDGFSDIGSTWYLYEADYGQTAVTEVAFLGVTAGTTEYMIGDTIFHVTVEMAEIDCEAVIGEALVLPMRGSYQISSGYTRYATVTFADGALTINAYQPGTFTVTDKAAVYTIAVVEFDVNRVMPQTFELWQTNSPVTADGSSTAVIHASDPGVSSVAGETLKKLLPEYAVTETNGVEVIYWRSRLLMPANGEEQTTDSAVDMTNSGEALVYIRYYDRLWQYSSDRIHWADIPDGCQLVSYYMEETDLADEVHVALADWGFKSGQSWGYRPDNSVVSLSVMIVYEDGTTVPAAVDAGLIDTTLLFGLSSAARGIGTAVIIDSDEYRVWQVTAEKGSMQCTVTGQTVNVSDFAWNDNETVIWDENGDDSAYVTFEDGTVTIMNRADVPGTNAVYDNLTWNQNNDSILLRVYIRAAETEELLTVVCYDEVYGMEIPGATYHIAVPVDGTFYDSVVNEAGASVILHTTSFRYPNGMIVPRYDISGLGVSNVLGVNQRFKTSIADQTSATHHYDPRLYIYNGAEISDDGKVMTVFYKINKACFIQEYLYDFGLPICFELSDFTVPRAEILDVALEGGRYGSFTLDRASGILTYTPEQTLDNIEILTIYIKYLGFAPQVFHVGVFPATNIYYEEGFADGLSGGTMGSVGQENHLVGDGRYNAGIVYGNDVAYMRFYDDDSIPMMPDTDGVLSDTASFTFFGSGVDVYAVCTAETGSVQMTVYDTDHNAVAAVLADTVLDPVYAALVGGTERSVRIAEIRDLPRGSYTLEMESVSAAPVRIDGFRVYGVIANIVENAYLEDKEDRRIDISFADFTPSYLDSSEENQVPGENAILAVTGWDMTNNMGLMTGAPNGDIRLAPGQALTLHISAEGNIRLMARSMGGEAAVIVNNGFAVICSETTMFYDPDLWYDDTDTPVTIYNIGPGMLVLSGITFCEDLHAELMPLEAADTAAALAMCTEPEDPDVGGEEPDVPEIPMETRTLVVSLVDYRNNTVGTVNLEKNVIAGQRCTFYAAEISNAVSQNLPSKYALYEDEVFRSVIVRADETGSVTYHVGKVAELKIVVNAPGVSLSKLTQQIFYLRAIQKTSAKSCTFTTAQIKAAVGDYRVTVAYNVSVNYGSTQTLTLMAR